MPKEEAARGVVVSPKCARPDFACLFRTGGRCAHGGQEHHRLRGEEKQSRREDQHAGQSGRDRQVPEGSRCRQLFSEMSRNEHDSQPNLKRSRQVEVGGSIGEIHLLEEQSPRYELRIDREGRWFHEGVEIVREEIRNLFSHHLVRCADGTYCVRMEGDEARVIVDDVPFLIVRVTKNPDCGLTLVLNDGALESLDARTIVFRNSNVPYCRVRGGLEARFSRPAYYQLAEFIEYDERSDRFRLVLDGEAVELEIT